MPEQTREVKTFRVDYICDTCGRAAIQQTGMVSSSYPALYEHKCPACGVVSVQYSCYPTIRYKEDVR